MTDKWSFISQVTNTMDNDIIFVCMMEYQEKIEQLLETNITIWIENYINI